MGIRARRSMILRQNENASGPGGWGKTGPELRSGVQKRKTRGTASHVPIHQAL